MVNEPQHGGQLVARQRRQHIDLGFCDAPDVGASHGHRASSMAPEGAVKFEL
jgi:hypothetical protein